MTPSSRGAAPDDQAGCQRPGRAADQADLRAYRALIKAPITSQYKGFDVYGMPVPSSGGIAVAEILNLIEAYEARTGQTLAGLGNAKYLHWFSEASATAFADRNRYVGDVPIVPVTELISDGFAAERACLFDPNHAQTRPIPFGSPDGSLHLVPHVRRPPGPALRGPVDDPPRHRRQVGQRGVLHPDHRADRRLRHHRARATASCSTTS